MIKQRSIALTLSFLLIALTGCDRKNNPLLSYPSPGVTSASLFIPQIDTADSSGVNRIFIYATDNIGNPISSFQLGNFSIIEGGNPGIPFEVGDVNESLNLALAIDRSGSMSGSKTTAANTAATTLINALGAGDYAALIEFSSEVATTVDFTTDKATLNAAIAAGTASGGTALYDATKACADRLNGRSGRRLMIVLTDGVDTASFSSINDAINAVNSRGLSAYMVGIGVDGIDFDANVLTQIATDTGGTFASSSDGSGLSAIFLSILDRFENLTYIKYQRRTKGSVKAYLNYGDITAQASKSLD